MKRVLSFILAFAIILGAIPINDLVVWAEDEKSQVTEVDIIKNFRKDKRIDRIIVKLIGKNLGKATVHIDLGGNMSNILVADNNSTETFRQYVLTGEEIDKLGGIGKEIIVSDDINGTKRYDIGDLTMPTVKDTSPANGIVKTGETITITGDRLNEIGKGSITAYFKPAGTPISIAAGDIQNSKIVKQMGTEVGKYDVVFEHNETVNGVKVKREHYYLDVFSVYGDLNISDEITMTPNQGAPETLVSILADELIEEMSVFFKKNIDDLYEIKSMGEFVSYKKDAEGIKDKYIFKVPNLPQGSYEVVLTNKVNKNEDPNKVVSSSKAFAGNIFIIISDANKPSITEILPNKGPATGTDATIKGRFLGSISPNIFTLNEGVVPVLNPEGTIDENDKTIKDALTITYGDGTQVIGRYNAIRKGKNNEPVEVLFLERKVTGVVGNNLSFRRGSALNPKGTDSIEVRVPQVTDEETDPIKDVTLEMETKIRYRYKDENGAEITEEITLNEDVEKKRAFTFEQLSYRPEITTITPNKIPVDKVGDNSYKTSIEGMKIAIYGKNFSVYRYVENGIVRQKYPEINIGNQIKLNKNIDNNVEIKVFDSNGNEVDGSLGNDLGVKILITIPKDLPNSGLDGGFLGSNTDVWVVNPNRNDNSTELGYTSNPGQIQFTYQEEDKIPTITSITPNVVTIEGQKGVVITGQKFFPGVKVYMDGEEIKNAKRNELGTEITFDAPAKPEGFVQIIVQNEEGGAAVHYPFSYVKTYTRPRFIDFNPKKGTVDTLVTIKGENLVLPNPLVKDLSGNGVDKLIGTKVFLGGKDINEYNRNSQTGQIELQEYETREDIIKNESGNIVLSDYYYSVILKQGTTDPIYYTIYFDTKTGQVKLTDGDRGIYILRGRGSGIVGFRDGKEYDLTVNNDSIEIDGKTLKIMTPYAVTGGKITGNKVKVINNSELQFTVPPLGREGYYDVTIVNPDTTRDSKTGNNGFYYAYQPEYNLDIVSIKPNEGSVDGGYYITITGSESKKFIDNGGDNKTSVFIGGVKVDPKDVEISIDRKSIIVKVPKYPGDLSTETEMDRKTVPVVVVNPDGGSGKKEDGFTYILPISYPKINNVIEKEGSAAGDITVYVEGSEFRFYEPYKDLNNNLEYDNGEPFTDLNGDGKWTDLRGKKMEELSEADKKILPKIYFGGELATIVSFTSTMIEVKTPKGQAGAVDVYLVNNDQGISNKVIYTYKASSPKITNVSPSIGRKQGGDKVEILGEGFTISNIRVYNSTNIPTGRKTIQLVQFGDNNNKSVSNKSITSTDDKNTGNFSENRTKDIEIGNLTIKYENGKLMVIITEGVGDAKVEYKNTFDYDREEIFLPINLLKDSDGNSYNGNELVRIKVERLPGASTTSRLRIDRGFSPNATLRNQGHINVITPNYYTVGKVQITVINPDGGEARGEFEYKNPDSNPEITNILKDEEPGYQVEDGRTIIEVNYLGGNIIEIQGRDFRQPVKIEIGDIKINVPIEYEPDEAISNTLRFTMPAVDSRYINTYHKLKVINEDGGTCDSGNIEIRFIMPEVTGLQITKVTPSFGPTSGGTVITIEGKDFREKIDNRGELKVYITKGNKQIRVPKEDIISISIDKIVLRTPAFEAGKVGIKVENPDGGMAELKDAFTYVSNPKISSIVSPEDDRRIIETISIEGGERIKILGSDFMEGARVVFVPNLRQLTDKEEATDYITIGADRYVIEGGADGTEVEVVDGQTILVTTPPGKLGDKGVIVINPDKSATNIYNIIYGIPETGAPLDVRIEVVFDQFIRVFWTGVKEAFEYEIYISEDGGKFEFIGSTELTSYAVQKIKPNTRYQVLVRAIGKYGTSKPIRESQSNIITTGRDVGPIDNDGKLGENTVINRNGSEASIVIGSKDFTSKGMTIDLTRGSLQGVKDISIRIPASIIASSTGKITVIGKDYNMNFNPSIFKNSDIINNKDNSNAGVVFKILTYKGSIDAKAGSTILGTTYLLEGSIYIGKNSSNIEHLNGNIMFSLDHDILKVQSRRLNNIQLVRYDYSGKLWISVQGVSRLGIYTVIGSRR